MAAKEVFAVPEDTRVEEPVVNSSTKLSVTEVWSGPVRQQVLCCLEAAVLASVCPAMRKSFSIERWDYVHISGVRPLVSGRSTDTSPGESSRSVCTAVGFLRRAAAPRGLIDLTPEMVALDALRVRREISRWVMIALRIFRREMDITGALDASAESQLNIQAISKRRTVEPVFGETDFWPVRTLNIAFRPSS